MTSTALPLLLNFANTSTVVYLASTAVSSPLVIMDSRVVAAAASVVLSGCYRKIKAHQAQKAKRKRRYNASIMIEDLIREPSGKLENFLQMSYTEKAIPAQERFCVALRFLLVVTASRAYHTFSNFHHKLYPGVVSTFVMH
nr:unnamed protein product [Callosobruchus analis]